MQENRPPLVPTPDFDASEEIDRATAASYQRVRAAHRAFIHSIETASAPELTGQRQRILILPGAFHAQYSHTGADGQRIVEIAEELGWNVERVPVPGLASMKRNAAALADFLATRRGEPIALVSLSKGGADVRTAMARPNAASEMRNVRTWLNISGMVHGTPLIAWLRNRPLRCLGVRILLRIRMQRFADVEELQHGAGMPLDPPFTVPTHIRAIHVAGYPRKRDLSNEWARRGHARLAPLGPNDGGGIMLQDVERLPGDVYPVWGADHYLQPAWDVRPLLLRILQEAARPPAAASQLLSPHAIPSDAPESPAIRQI